MNTRGQTLIELLILIAALSAISVATIGLSTDTLNESRFNETKRRLNTIRNALVGDPTLMQIGARSNFGYQGDVGGIPGAIQGLQALWSAPAGIPAYTVDSTGKIGIGWNGPYLDATVPGADHLNDGWGNPFVYNPSNTPPTVVSYGADGVAGGTGYNQDITMELPANVLTATVFGVIRNNGSQWSGSADIDLNLPDGSGALKTLSASISAPDNGAFSFAGVPIGIRSVTVYVPSKVSPAQVLGPVIFAISGNWYLVPAKSLDLKL
jgi:type II secretory pathway pseudopilin PulG